MQRYRYLINGRHPGPKGPGGLRIHHEDGRLIPFFQFCILFTSSNQDTYPGRLENNEKLNNHGSLPSPAYRQWHH